MSHLDYYRYQACARGIQSAGDVARCTDQFAYLYQRMLTGWLPGNSAAITELACGHGSFLLWLRRQGYARVRGVDASPEQLAHARAAALDVIAGDALEWLAQQGPATCDVIFAIDFIEHISKDQLMQLLRETHRVLNPGGKLIVRYPNGDSPFVGLNLFNDITHVWTYTTNCLRTLASMHGFSRVEFRDQGVAAIRDQRWWKVPLARVGRGILRALAQAGGRERIEYWNSSIWACLYK